MIYYKSRLHHIVRGKPISPLERLRKPLNSEFWIILIVFFSSKIIFIYALKLTSLSIRHFILGQENKSAVINFLGSIVGYPVIGIPSRNFARFVLVMILLSNFVIRTVYLGSLFEVMQVNKTYAKLPSGIEDLLKGNYTFLLSPGIKYMNLHANSKTITVLKPFAKRMEMLEKSNGNYASIALHHCFVNFALKAARENIENNLIMVEEIFLMYQMSMGFAKRSTLHDVISKKLEIFSQVGILSKLSKQLRDENVESKSPLKIVRLTLKQLQGIFEILLYMNIIAIGVFGLEMIAKRFRKIKFIFDLIS